MQVTLHANLPAALGEREQPTHRRRMPVPMTAGECGDIGEVDTPFLFDVGAAAHAVVGISVGVSAKPQVDRSVVLGQVCFERL